MRTKRGTPETLRCSASEVYRVSRSSKALQTASAKSMMRQRSLTNLHELSSEQAEIGRISPAAFTFGPGERRYRNVDVFSFWKSDSGRGDAPCGSDPRGGITAVADMCRQPQFGSQIRSLSQHTNAKCHKARLPRRRDARRNCNCRKMSDYGRLAPAC